MTIVNGHDELGECRTCGRLVPKRRYSQDWYCSRQCFYRRPKFSRSEPPSRVTVQPAPRPIPVVICAMNDDDAWSCGGSGYAIAPTVRLDVCPFLLMDEIPLSRERWCTASP